MGRLLPALLAADLALRKSSAQPLRVHCLLCDAPAHEHCFHCGHAGTKGKRYSMPNSRIMIHQPLGGASGAAVDIEIQVGAQRAVLQLAQGQRICCCAATCCPCCLAGHPL